jgi:uncharacterized phage infection (PIP) family protein YhgE
MVILSARYISVFVLLVLVGTLALIDASAQSRRRRTKRLSRPPVARPAPSPSPDEATDPTDPRIVSTADQSVTPTKSRSKASPSPTPVPEAEQLRRTITDLSGQVDKLTDKLGQMEEQQRSLYDLERLSRAEQRAETFRSQLRDVQEKETEVQSQLDQLAFALQPEQIERSVAVYGTTRPEVAREQRKKQLENQLAKLKAQFDQLEQSRVRLEAAVRNADTEVDRLQREIDLKNAQTNQPPLVAPSPTPSETPPQSQR